MQSGFVWETKSGLFTATESRAWRVYNFQVTITRVNLLFRDQLRDWAKLPVLRWSEWSAEPS